MTTISRNPIPKGLSVQDLVGGGQEIGSLRASCSLILLYLAPTTLVGEIVLCNTEPARFFPLSLKNIAFLQEDIPKLVQIIKRLESELASSP